MKRIHCFSLTELLVVICILMILLSLLSPALKQAVESTQQVTCASNFKTIAMESFRFSEDHNGHFVGSGGKLKFTGPNNWAGNGTTPWPNLFNAVVFPDDSAKVSVISSNGLAERELGCPKQVKYGRFALAISSLTTGNGLNVPEDKWPEGLKKFSWSTTNAFYNLGCRATDIANPSSKAFFVDWQHTAPLGAWLNRKGANQMDLKFMSNGVSVYAYENTGGIALRHGTNDPKFTISFIDGHVEAMNGIPSHWWEISGGLE